MVQNIVQLLHSMENTHLELNYNNKYDFKMSAVIINVYQHACNNHKALMWGILGRSNSKLKFSLNLQYLADKLTALG